MKSSEIYYSVGALLYSPANNAKIAEEIASERFGRKYSIALCLEDTIKDDRVEEAEKILAASFRELDNMRTYRHFYIPKIFIRVRRPEQIRKMFTALGNSADLLTGFILPKVTPQNLEAYLKYFAQVKRKANKDLYIMPIIENEEIIDPQTRISILSEMKKKLDTISENVLNIRVGGNDLCNAFGFRRHNTETIYDIRPIADILSDIVTVFGRDYVISGPVWEYYNGKGWDSGMKNELMKDIQAGFIGKTVIHPKQIELVNKSLYVSKADYDDAVSIANWDAENLVSGSSDKSRMNEYKTHYRWAKQILFLASYYGIK